MIRKLFGYIYNSLFPTRICGQGNTLLNKSKFGKNFHIHINGNNNKVLFGNNCLLTNTNIVISGEENEIIVDDNVRLMGPCRIIISGGGKLHIKYNAGIRGVEFNLNGSKVEVGELCMFSYGITIRNHDSHKILDPKTKQILNPSKEIVLGKHVWLAQNATILKGCHIGDDSVIGFGAIVTKNCNPGSIMTGVPARVVKEGITWNY